MSEEPLRVTEAGRRMGISTREVLTLAYERKLRYVMRRGIVHVPPEAIDEYRTQAG